MRSLILLLMIALMPLRLWAADTMALGMAGPAQSAGSAAAAPMPADCPMTAAQADEGRSQDTGGGAACQACQLCVALGTSLALQAPGLCLPRLHASAALPWFESADALLDHKPPIA